MNTIQVCRMCLAHDTRMYTIAYEPLQKFYEKITGKVYKMENGRLSVLCYICFHLLKKCHKFTESAIKADEVLQQICKSGIQISKEYISVKRNPLLIMAYKNSPVTIVNVELVSEVKSKEGKDSSNINWTSSEQQNTVATEIHEDEVIAYAHIKEETDLDVTGIEEDLLCSEDLVSQDLHGSDIHGDDTEDVENGSILAMVEDEDTCSLEVLENVLHHHSPESDNVALLDDVGVDEENGDDDRTSMLEKYGPENKDALAKPCAVVLRRDEQIERMLQETQAPRCLRARTPGPKYRKLDQTIQYPENLPVQASSRENTGAENASEFETNISKYVTEVNVQCSDDGHTRPYLSLKKASEKQDDKLNQQSRVSDKRASDKSYDFNEIMIQMCNKISDEQKFICDYCEKDLTQKSVLKAHLKIHTGVKPFTCSHCGKKFTRMDTMKDHLRIHTGEKPFTCSHCGKKFTRMSTMKNHLKIHTGEKPFTCSHCGKKFTRMSTMKNHIRIHTGEKPLTCRHCGKKFRLMSTMKVHLRIHAGEMPFTCSHCGKKFDRIGHMKIHLRVHTGEKPHVCDHCGKNFRHMSTMKRHFRIHAGEKPFTCSHCGKKFTQKSDMKVHLRVHTGEKPHACGHCGKMFTRMSTMRDHLRIHSGEKPFTCSHCEKKFTHMKTMKDHLKIHTGEKPFTCSHCGKQFTRMSTMKNHLRIHTGE